MKGSGRFRAPGEELDIVNVRGCGLFLGVEPVRDRGTGEPATKEASYACTTPRGEGVVCSSALTGPGDNALVIDPPVVFSLKDVDTFVDRFDRAVREDLAGAGDVRSLARTPT